MSNPNQVGSFVPTTNIWDVGELYRIDITSPQFIELLVRLYQNLNRMSTSLNSRDAGYYNTQEFVNGQLFFPNPALNSTSQTNPTFRQVFRTVVNFGALPNTATKSVPHNINPNSGFTFTRIYATASDTSGMNYIPIPYASNTAGNSIELSVDATNVNITTGSDRTNFTITYVILEYLKS